jgi:hypothetical protein
VQSLPRHLDHGLDGSLEIARVVRRSFVSIAKIHAVAAPTHLPQSESEMARHRFGLGERHGFLRWRRAAHVMNSHDEAWVMKHGRRDTARFSAYVVLTHVGRLLSDAKDMLIEAKFAT